MMTAKVLGVHRPRKEKKTLLKNVDQAAVWKAWKLESGAKSAQGI